MWSISLWPMRWDQFSSEILLFFAILRIQLTIARLFVCTPPTFHNTKMDSEQRDDIPKRPKAVLAGHIVTKLVQVGAVAGVLTGIPYTLRKRRQMYSGQTALTHVERWALFNRFGRHVFTATMLGLAAGSIVAFAKVRNLDQTGIEDRAYRLKVIHNIPLLTFHASAFH